MENLRVTLAGAGFAADYTARTYKLLPHKNGVQIDLVGIAAGRPESAARFAARHGIAQAYASHAEMMRQTRPHIAHIVCANYVHGQYVMEAAAAGVRVIVLEKPPVIWPGHPQQRTAAPAEQTRETMDYLALVLDAVHAAGARLLYAEDFVYVDGVKALVELLIEARRTGQGKLLYLRGICAHQGSHAPAYDTPSLSGGGALFNKACHPLGPCLYLKQVEGILRDRPPLRPVRVAAHALQILKHQPSESHVNFRVMQNVEDFGRITVEFEDQTIAEVHGHDLSVSGIRNELSAIADFGQCDIRINPNNANELFLPRAESAGDLLLREKLPTPAGTSFPSPNQFAAHGYVSETSDAVDCALDAVRQPQSGPMLAWDTQAVLMAAYESNAAGGAWVDIRQYTLRREFERSTWPDPYRFGRVLQRVGR